MREVREELQDRAAARVLRDAARDLAVHLDPLGLQRVAELERAVAGRDVVERDRRRRDRAARSSAGASSGGDGSVSTSTRSSTRRENGTPRRSVSSPSPTSACSERSIRRGIDVQEEQALVRQALAPPRARRSRRTARRPARGAATRPPGKISAASRVVPVRAPAAQQPLVPEDRARREIEDRLELDEELARSSARRRARAPRPPPRPRQRRQVAHRVPLRLAHVLGRHAHAIGQGARGPSPAPRGRARACARRAGAGRVRTSGARAQLRPNAAATARSASSPSGRTKTARAFRQRSSRPSVWPSRTLPDAFTAFDSTPRRRGR